MIEYPVCVFQGNIGPDGETWRVIVQARDCVVVETRREDAMGGERWEEMDPSHSVYALLALKDCAVERADTMEEFRLLHLQLAQAKQAGQTKP